MRHIFLILALVLVLPNCGDTEDGYSEFAETVAPEETSEETSEEVIYTCVDNSDFVDAQGYRCLDWAGFDCDRAVEDWNYTAEQKEDIKSNCLNSCNLYKLQGAVPVLPCTIPYASSLSPNASIALGQYLASPNGQYRFYLQDDGNLVLRTWPTETVSWASGTNGKGGVRFIFQSDGNLVLYTSANSPVWASNTVGSGATILQLNNNGSLVLYRGTTVVWSKGGSTPPPPPPPPPNTYKYYHGDLHTHTGYSDGAGTPSSAFAAAKAYAAQNPQGGDFMAITDHTDWPNRLTTTEINSTVSAANSATSGTFVGLYGWELTSDSEDDGHFWGHMNYFNTTRQLYCQLSRVQAYDALASDTNIIAQFNHPDQGNQFNNFSDWTAARNRVIRLYEVINGPNPSEYVYIHALNAGWKLAPTANSDMHGTDWLRFQNRTTVLATSLTRDAIYDAIRNLRVYASQDRNVEVNFTINGSVMGSTISNPASCAVVVRVNDPSTSDSSNRTTRIEIMSDGATNGTIVASQTFNSHSVTWNVTIPPGTHKWFFPRITNAGGKKTFAAPIWIAR